MLMIDRIEADIAICEQPDRTMVSIPLSTLPDGVREGDCLLPQNDGTYRVDAETTARRRKQNAQRLQNLLKKK